MISMDEKLSIYLNEVADKVYGESLSEMSDIEFFELYDSGELDELIHPHLKDCGEQLDIVRAILVSYFDF